MHRSFLLSFLLLLSMLSAPTVAQLDEAETTFSITTERTFGSKEKAGVRLWGQGFSQLQFRLYRVRDAERFFRELEDPNQFGGQSHRPPQALTLLEKYHRWKQQSRSALRNIVRRQYSNDSRQQIRASLVKATEGQSPIPAKSSSTTTTEYADVPILNRQQLVAVWDQPFRVARQWESVQVPLNIREPGLYLVEATDGKLQAYTIVCVSDLVLLTKTGEGTMLARAVDRNSGAPVEGVEIKGWIRGEQVITARSDRGGFAAIQPAKSTLREGADNSIMLLARHQSALAPVAISEWQIRQGQGDASLTGYVYTDRPVYRPGHQVKFKAILRLARSLGYELPSTTSPVEVTIEDPEGKQVSRQSLRPNAYGTLNGELAIAPAAPLGYYNISVRSGNNYAGNAGFQVEEYRKPEYEVRVTPGTADPALQGEVVHATVNARYYFGEPVTGGKVKYVVHRSRYWPPWYAEDPEERQEADPGDNDEYLGNEQILEGDGKLDANGLFNLEFTTETANHDLRYRIEARVTDEANREVTGVGWALATRARFFISAEPERYVYEPGEKARIRVEARDSKGNTVPNIAFEVQLKAKDKLVTTVTGRTGPDGSGVAEVNLTSSGSLHAVVTARDNDGRQTGADTYLWVSGAGWDWGRQSRIEIIPDNKTYKAGDTAKVLLVTGVPEASVWVTGESRGVIFSRVVEAKGPTVSFEVPVEPGYAPNIYLSATFIRDGQLYSGMKSLRVPAVDRKIDVSVTPSKTQFRPGEKGVYTIEAKDAGGRPVNAEFSLGVVDEAIYAIRRESVGDISQFFYGRRFSAVQTTSSLHYSFSGSSGKRRMHLVAMPFERRAQLKPDKFVDPRVRKAFPDTLYWAADVRTGPSGRAEVAIEYPDALTTWRATARGITADTKAGSAIDRTIVRRNLILRLAAPRFFMQGDDMTIAAVVQNYLPTAKTVRVSLEAKGLEVVDGGAREINIPSRGTHQLLFRVRVNAPGEAVLLGKALTDEESDALELTIPVNPYGVRLSESRAGLIESGGSAETRLQFPADSNPSSRTVAITVSPSVVGTMFSALDYLVTFPYGCTEQTMSSFLPNVIVSQATRSLGIKGGVDQAALARKTRAGLERLYSYQHDDGGWGWWHADESSPFMTGYVVAGLAQARAAGYSVNTGALDKAVAWLRSELPKQKKQPPRDLQAYLAWALALAEQPDPALVETVWSKRAELSPYGLALLGLATPDTARKAELAGLLERQAKSTANEVWWEMDNDPLLEIGVNTTAEATAFALRFLVAQRPDSALLPKAALYLTTHRDGGYYWTSTKQTAMVIFGLTEYLKATKELQPDFTAEVSVNGASVGSRRFTAPESWTLRLPAGAAADIRVTKSGTGRLYWSAQSTYYSTAEKLASSGNAALGVTRDYFRLQSEKQGDKVVYRLLPLEGSVGKGDVIAVRLRVHGTGWSYLLTEDPIPAGTEFVNRDDLYELANKPDWWARWFSRREFHDDRMALFQQHFRSEDSEQSYLLKVISSGKFRVPPARVQPMYQPGVYATSGSSILEVR